MMFGRRRDIQEKPYVRDGMLLYLDGRDTPVGDAWVDRVNGTACPIVGAIMHSASEKCYKKQDDTFAYVMLPDSLPYSLITAQVVFRNDTEAPHNGAILNVRSCINTKNVLNIWNNRGLNPNKSSIIYWRSGGSFHETLFSYTVNEIHSISASRNNGDCKSCYDGQITTLYANLDVPTHVSSMLFSDNESWTLGPFSIHCVRIYNRVLSDDEILKNYNTDKKIFNAL
jgi:hypothetical protein